jgi:hypothetical protein
MSVRLVVWPAAGVLILVLIGFAAIAFGVTLLMLGLRRRESRHDPATAGHHRRPATS